MDCGIPWKVVVARDAAPDSCLFLLHEVRGSHAFQPVALGGTAPCCVNPSAPTPVVQFNKLRRVMFDLRGTLTSTAEHRTGRCMPAGRGSARQGEDRTHDAASLHGRNADVHAGGDARCVIVITDDFRQTDDVMLHLMVSGGVVDLGCVIMKSHHWHVCTWGAGQWKLDLWGQVLFQRPVEAVLYCGRQHQLSWHAQWAGYSVA